MRHIYYIRDRPAECKQITGLVLIMLQMQQLQLDKLEMAQLAA